MAQTPFPYTFYSCPCSGAAPIATKRTSQQFVVLGEEEERTFNPRAPLSNYSLYPLENLLYCNDCKEIRCPRCCTEEVVTWYCPQCLFEVTGLGSRTEGGRCVIREFVGGAVARIGFIARARPMLTVLRL